MTREREAIIAFLERLQHIRRRRPVEVQVLTAADELLEAVAPGCPPPWWAWVCKEDQQWFDLLREGQEAPRHPVFFPPLKGGKKTVPGAGARCSVPVRSDMGNGRQDVWPSSGEAVSSSGCTGPETSCHFGENEG